LPDYAAPEDMEWSPDGRLIAAAVSEKLVVWRTDTGEELVGQEQDISATGIISCCVDPLEVHQLAWAPDSSLIAIAEQQREGTRLTVVGARTGEIVYRRTLSHGDPFVIDPWVAWAPDGERVALFEPYYQMDDEGNVSERAYLSVHHIPSGEIQTVVELGQSDAWEFPLVISEMTWSPEGRFVVTVHGGIAHAPEGWFGNIGDDAAINFWDPETGALVRALRGHANDIVDIAWSPDGKTLASASIDGTVILWEITP
jgi:WD40 repeat protein